MKSVTKAMDETKRPKRDCASVKVILENNIRLSDVS